MRTKFTQTVDASFSINSKYLFLVQILFISGIKSDVSDYPRLQWYSTLRLTILTQTHALGSSTNFVYNSIMNTHQCEIAVICQFHAAFIVL